MKTRIIELGNLLNLIRLHKLAESRHVSGQSHFMSGVLKYLWWQREDTAALWQLLLICEDHGGVLSFSSYFLAIGACLIVSTTCLARFFRPLVRPHTRYYLAHITLAGGAVKTRECSLFSNVPWSFAILGYNHH